MARGRRAVLAAAVSIASLFAIWKPLPSGGASGVSGGDSLFVDPYLTRLRASTEVLPDDEIRALWVVRDALSSPESVSRLVDFAVQTRFHLLFVQVRGRGDAWYRSQFEPIAPQVSPTIDDFDPLAYLTELAHREGIAVHAWINVFYVWSNPKESPPPASVASRNPEWLLTDARGTRMDRVPASRWKQERIEGMFLAPGASGLRPHMQKVVRELVANYHLDGIHLDYIRYPNRTYSFDPESRSRFTLRYGVDPAELVAGDRAALQKLVGKDALGLLDSLYTEYRTAQVDSMVAAIHAVANGLPVSAAVIADPLVARNEKGQEWARWVHKRWVDFVVPMTYGMPPLEIEHRAGVYQRTVGADRVLIGLAAYDGMEDDLAESVALLRELGVAGYAIFSYNSLLESGSGAELIESSVLPPDTVDTDEEADSTESTWGEEEDGEEEE